MTKSTIIANQYEINEELGTGGMGTVYRGTDRQTGHLVAIKALKEDVIRYEPMLLARFEREGEALRRLNHPNIVKMLATVYENNAHYLVMEYVGGGSLVELLEKWPTLPIKQVLRIGMGIADALTQTHSMNIIHRDIKPANILLTEGGTPRLTDFGVAHTDNSNLTQTGMLMGTLAYLSPEAFRNQNMDTRSDIWSFGVTLFELVTGFRPFRGDNFVTVMQSVITDPVPDLEMMRKDAPIQLIDLIYRMLEKNPDARIPSIQMVGAELEATLYSLPATSPRLRVVAHMMMQGGVETSRFEQPTSLAAPHHNLPHQASAFIGRERELRDLGLLLNDKRLVSIVAPDGNGKTRLALQLAQTQVDHMKDGVYVVPLENLTDYDTLPTAIANGIGYTLTSDAPTAQLLNYLQAKNMLLLLDAVQDVTTVAALLQDMLQTTSQVRVVVTATAPLGLYEETVFELEGLPYRRWKKPRTAMEYGSAQLFVQTAHQVDPIWELTSNDLPHLYKLCQLLDGMPLGIKLAAGSIADKSLEELAQETSRMLEFLAVDMPSECARRIRAIFDVAIGVLSDEQRTGLMRLAFFRNGFRRDAAQEVTEMSLQTLRTLTQHQIIERNKLGRFTVHPVIQHFLSDTMHDQPDDTEKSRTLHCSHYADYLRKRKYELRGHRQIEAIADIRSEMANIQAAWSWAITHNLTTALHKMTAPLGMFFCLEKRYFEGLHLLQVIDAIADPVKTNIDCQRAACLTRLGHHEEARSLLESSLKQATERKQHGDIARCLYWLGQSDDDNAAQLFAKGLHHARKADDKFMLVRLLNSLSRRTEEQLSKESLALALESGDRFGEIEAWDTIVDQAIAKGDFATAVDGLENMRPFYQQIGDQHAEALVLWRAGRASLLLGDLPTARQYLNESIAISQQVNDQSNQGIAQALLGLLASLQGQYTEAKQLCQTLADQKEYPRAVLYANIGLSHTLCALGSYQDAEQHLKVALLHAETPTQKLLNLINYAWVNLARGDVERAAELLALSLHHPDQLNWIGQDPSVKRLRAQLADTMNEEVYDAATKRGSGLNLDTVVAEIMGQ